MYETQLNLESKKLKKNKKNVQGQLGIYVYETLH